MNGAERIAATLAGKTLDRRAFIPVLSLYGARLTDCPLYKYYSDPAAYAAGQYAVYKEFDPDIIFAPFAFALIGAAFGSDIKLSLFQPPNIKTPAVPTNNNWEEIVFPDIDTNHYLLYFRQAIMHMTNRFQGDVPIAACLPAPIDIPALILGMEGWLDLLMFKHEDAVCLLKRVNTFFTDLANRLFTDGAMVAFLPCGYASPAVMMREKVESIMRPAMKDALSQLRGPAVIHHCGAVLLDHLDILSDLPSTVGFALGYEEGLDKARRVIGPEPALLSGPHGPSLAEMDEEQVEMICRLILEERHKKQDSRFILVTLGADVPYYTPPENLHAMRKAVLKAARNNI